MHIGIRIKSQRELLNLTQQELADKLGYKSKTTINKIENGTNDITHSRIIAFAEALETTPSYLMGWTDQKSSDSSYIRIPVLGRVAAGVPSNAVEEIIDWEEIPKAQASTGDFFGLVINGDSMDPVMFKGDVVIVKKQSDLESGDIGIVLVGDHDGTCKKVVKHEEGISLVSFNPSYPPSFSTWKEVEQKPIAILGKVVELRRKF